MHPLIDRLRTPRTIRSHLARLLLVRSVGFVVLVATALFGQSLAIQTSGAELEALPGVVPTWSVLDQAKYPGCTAAEDWPPNTWGSSIIGYSPVEGRTVRIDFDRAWELTHNADEADDVTVLGICG